MRPNRARESWKNLTLHGVVAFGILGCPQSAGAVRGFMEIEGRVIPSEHEDAATLQIEEISQIVPEDSLLAIDTLTVSCPARELVAWKASFTRGDTLRLEWDVDREPSTGFLLWGGKGGRARLAVPKEGWQISCGCAPKGGHLNATLYGTFLDRDGRARDEFHRRGSSEFFLFRLLPFMKGSRAEPGKVRIRFAWNRNELREEAIAGSARSGG